MLKTYDMTVYQCDTCGLWFAVDTSSDTNEVADPYFCPSCSDTNSELNPKGTVEYQRPE